MLSGKRKKQNSGGDCSPGDKPRALNYLRPDVPGMLNAPRQFSQVIGHLFAGFEELFARVRQLPDIIGCRTLGAVCGRLGLVCHADKMLGRSKRKPGNFPGVVWALRSGAAG